MGYTTDFWGELTLSKPLTKEELDYIYDFSVTRRMKRDVNKLMELYDGKFGHPNPIDKTPEGIYGHDGEYFVHDDGNDGQEHDVSIIDYNCPPGQMEYDSTFDFSARWDENRIRIASGTCQPGLCCQWIVKEDEGGNQVLMWDGGEKFYNYVEWLKYLIVHFFEKWNVKLNGEIEWAGEDINDRGKIVVKDNVVKVLNARIVYEEE